MRAKETFREAFVPHIIKGISYVFVPVDKIEIFGLKEFVYKIGLNLLTQYVLYVLIYAYREQVS